FCFWHRKLLPLQGLQSCTKKKFAFAEISLVVEATQFWSWRSQPSRRCDVQTATQATPTRSPDSPAISKFARRHIERKARQLIRRVDGNLCDKEDLVQELTLILLERLPQFNP